MNVARRVYLYAIEGDAEVIGERMTTGDAAQISDETSIDIAASGVTELIMVDVALT